MFQMIMAFNYINIHYPKLCCGNRTSLGLNNYILLKVIFYCYHNFAMLYHAEISLSEISAFIL